MAFLKAIGMDPGKFSLCLFFIDVAATSVLAEMGSHGFKEIQWADGKLHGILENAQKDDIE